jgi:hypothetical protein
MRLIKKSNDKMTKQALYCLTSFLFLFIYCILPSEFIQAASTDSTTVQMNPSEKQLLLNGKIWRNQYSKAIGDQFFLTNTFLKGSVTLNGRRFNNLNLKYDIANDELILSIEPNPSISMNKEMVDSFDLEYESRNYHIINAGTDNSNILRGYVNVIYDGPSRMYVKYTKKIQPLAVDGRFDLFIEEHRIYLRKGNEVVYVKGKKQFVNLLADKKKEIRYYIKSSRIKLTQKDPETFIPVLKYYDSIRE